MGLGDSIAGYLPNWNWSSIINLLLGLGIFLLFLAIVGGGVGLWLYWYISNKKFNKNIQIFEKIDGRYMPTFKDKATEMRIGNAGDTIFFCKKSKKYLPRPTIQTGINGYWFVKRDDGELINIGMEDIDTKMKQLGVFYVDPEMRYQRSALQKIIKERYDKKSFWQEHGSAILSILFIIIWAVSILLISKGYFNALQSVDNTLIATTDVLDSVKQVLSSLDNVCSTGMGGAFQKIA
jgi:hypothetical protein